MTEAAPDSYPEQDFTEMVELPKDMPYTIDRLPDSTTILVFGGSSPEAARLNEASRLGKIALPTEPRTIL